jgi:hypothetical protein
MAGNTITPRNLLLPVVDKLRGIPGIFGLRLYAVSLVTRTWSGSRPGVDASTSSDATAPMTVDLTKFNIKVRQVTSREVLASGGDYRDEDLKVGPITPPYQGSTADNDAIAIFDPPTATAATELFFNITGPGFQRPAGAWFKKVSQNVTAPMHYEVVVRHTGETP